jgi:hypothetical protein
MWFLILGTWRLWNWRAVAFGAVVTAAVLALGWLQYPIDGLAQAAVWSVAASRSGGLESFLGQGRTVRVARTNVRVGRSLSGIAPLIARSSSDGALQLVEELQRLAPHMVGELGLDDALDAARLDVADRLSLEIENGLHRAHHRIHLGVLR